MTRTDWTLLGLAALAAGGAVKVAQPPRKSASTSSPPTPRPPTAGGIQLEQGHSYQARIELSGIEAMLGTAGAVKSKLESAGFSNVVVADNGGGKFLAHGTWMRASTVAKLPSQVKEVLPLG